MCVRDIHIEIVPVMSTEALILALIQFCNIYCAHSHLYGDNEQSFNAALRSDIIKHHINSNDCSNTYENSVIKRIKISLYST